MHACTARLLRGGIGRVCRLAGGAAPATSVALPFLAHACWCELVVAPHLAMIERRTSSDGEASARASELRHWAPGGPQHVHLHIDFSGIAVLTHEITGERIQMQAGRSWRLGFSDGWAFVSSPGEPALWCSQLFKQSAWTDIEGRIFVRSVEAGAAGEPHYRTRWLHEISPMEETRYVRWCFQDLQPTSACVKTLGLRFPKAGCSRFWCLVDFQTCAEFEVSFAQGSKWISRSMPAWRKFLGSKGLSDEHVMRPVAGYGGDSLNIESWYFSTPAYLLWVAKLAAHMQLSNDRRKCMGFLTGLLRVSLSAGEFGLQVQTFGEPGVLQYDGLVMRTQAGCLFWSVCCDLFPSSLIGCSAASLLVHLVQRGSSGARAASQLACALGRIIDDGFSVRAWQTDPTQLPAGAGRKRKRADPALRMALVSMDGGRMKNSYLSGDAAKLFGRRSLKHKGWVDKALNLKYLLACARSCAGANTVAIATDSSKVAQGKSWLKTCIYNLERNEAMWCPPQAIPSQQSKGLRASLGNVPEVSVYL